jgi:hypothetical protein
MRALGTWQTLRATISEPEPGRVLVESYPETGVVTSFTVTSDEPGERTTVTIATGIPIRPGLRRLLERWFIARLLERIYPEELRRLASVAETKD